MVLLFVGSLNLRCIQDGVIHGSRGLVGYWECGPKMVSIIETGAMVGVG